MQRFGRTIHLFAPLYLSNECVSVCTYCGFSAGNEIARRTLTPGGGRRRRPRRSRPAASATCCSSPASTPASSSKDYLVECVRAVAPVVPQVSLEVQVWDTETYRRLVDAGCDGLVVYQEAYDPGTYEAVHLKGKKRNYAWRLAAPDRGARGGHAPARHRRAARARPRLAPRGDRRSPPMPAR